MLMPTSKMGAEHNTELNRALVYLKSPGLPFACYNAFPSPQFQEDVQFSTFYLLFYGFKWLLSPTSDDLHRAISN